MALRTVGVKLAAEVTGYRSQMLAASRSTKDFATDLDKASKAGKLDKVADGAAKMGLGLAAAFAGVVAVTAKFDKQMSEVGAVSDATTGQMGKLRQAALDAGKATSFSATEAAQAEAELAKAGISTADILGGALTGSLNLAAAGTLDLAEAADISAKTMNIFGLKGGDVGHIADVLAASANKSATDVHEMGEALKMGGLAAHAAGMGLEETSGTLAAFADNALNGSDAGTSLKTMLMMLQAPSGKAADLMKKLGINAYDAGGNFVGTAKLAGNLQQALGGMTQEQRNSALATIFGADAMRAANVLYGIGEQGINDYVKAVDDQGAAAKTAAEKTNNLAGDIDRLKGSLETLAIEAGSGSNGGLRTLVKAADGLVTAFGSLPPVVGSTITVLAGVSGVALLAGGGFLKVRKSAHDALSELRDMGPTGARAATGLGKVASAAGKVAGVFVALQVAGAAIGAMQKDLSPQTDAMAIGLEQWASGGQLAGEASRVLGTNLSDLQVGFKYLADSDNTRRGVVRWGQDLLESVVPGLDGTNTSLDRTRQRVTAIDQVMAQLVQGGKTQEASALFDQLAKTLAVNGVSVDELKKQFPEYAAALEVAASGTEDAAGKVTGLGGAASTAADKVQGLKDAFDRLFGVQMGIDQATLAYKKGLIEVKKELEHGTRTLNDNTKAGQDNVGGVLDQITRIKELRQARIDHGMALTDADAKYKTDLNGLRATLKQLGFNKTAVDELIDKYYKIPNKAKTEVSAPGAKQAKKEVDDFNFAVKTVPPSKTVPFRATVAEAKAAVNALKAKIAELKDKHVYITGSVRWTSSGDLKLPGGTQLKNRWGGVYEHAAEGLLRDAQIASPMGPARYAWAEPATGGEAFIPKYGDRSRSMGILDQAAGWYGATVRPVTTAQYAAPQVDVRVYLGDRELTDIVRVEVSESNRGLKRRVGAGSGAAR